MKTILSTLLSFALLLANNLSFAQQATDSSKRKVQFRLATFYTSAIHYYGRTDSAGSSALFPMAEIWFNEKFYISAAPIFTGNSKAGFEYGGTSLTSGWQVLAENKKIFSHTYVSVPLYPDNSRLPQSAMKAQAASTLTWLNKIINITGGADIKWSNAIDYGFTAGVDHIFLIKLPAHIFLVIDPSANIYAGTQRYSHTYTKKQTYLLFPPTEQQISEQVHKLSVLSYEFSSPVVISRKKWQLIFSPAYVVPKNLLVVPDNPSLSENGKPLFYTTIGLKLLL
jgi:hypothetical protein